MAPVVVHEQIALWVLFPETVQRMLSNALNLQMLAAVDLRWREVRDPFIGDDDCCTNDRERDHARAE